MKRKLTFISEATTCYVETEVFSITGDHRSLQERCYTIDMQVGALISWWYSTGWLGQVSRVRAYLARVADFFSIPLLLKTLFQPFRQIDSDSRGKSLDAALRAWADRTVSRFIGAMIRLVMIVLGSVWWVLSAVAGLVTCLVWPVLPVLPVVGVIFSGVFV